MSDKKKNEKSPKSAKSKKVLTEEEKAERAREEAAAEARKIAEATLSRYVSWVENLKGRNAFRGQANAKWPLQASAYRRLLNKQAENLELSGYLFTGYLHERVNETTMRFSAHSDMQPLKVMAQMQHHGAATGLIDFTESALAALWFACKDEQGKFGKVVAVRLDDGEKIQEIKKHEDMKGKLEKFFPINPDKKLWTWRPGDSDSRMVTQQSLFIFGRPEIGKEFISDEFSVSAEEKGRYMEILGRMGISENFIFSDFSGFSAANASDKDYPLHIAEIYYAEKVKDAEKAKKDAEKTKCAEKIKETSKNVALYYLQKGVFNAAQSAYKEAIADFTHAIELDPQYVGAYNNRGNALHCLGLYEDALADCTRAIELDPQNAFAYNNHGNALHGLGRHKEAISDFTRAIALDTQNALTYYNRGVALNSMGRHEDAIADFTHAIELNPQYAIAHNNRGNALACLNRHEEALVNFTRAIDLNPQHMGAYNNRGTALSNLGRHEEALADFACAIDLNPQNAGVYNNRGNVWSALGRHEEALVDYTRAIALNPQYAMAYNNRGAALGNLSRHGEAISDWKEAIRIGKQTGDKEIVQTATTNLANYTKPK